MRQVLNKRNKVDVKCCYLQTKKAFLNIEYAGQWKELCGNAIAGLSISNYTLVAGYTPKQSDLMLLIPDTYPIGMIDMFYFSPPVQRNDGLPITALSNENYFGISWQRWSRHYQWIPGDHDIATHMAYIKNALLDELRKK